MYTKQDFLYHAEEDKYECPAQQRLIRRTKTVEKGLTIYKYWTSNCKICPQREQCTTGKERQIGRWEHEACLDALEARLDCVSERMKVKRSTVEHSFATHKCWMRYTHFKMKKLKNVSTEMSLHVLAYNLTRVLNIIGVRKLLEAI